MSIKFCSKNTTHSFNISHYSFPERRHGTCIEEYGVNRSSLRGRRLKGKGKEVLGARETRGAREEGGGREGNACQETIVFHIPPTNYVCKNNATVND